jgi:hypothetical protein
MSAYGVLAARLLNTIEWHSPSGLHKGFSGDFNPEKGAIRVDEQKRPTSPLLTCNDSLSTCASRRGLSSKWATDSKCCALQRVATKVGRKRMYRFDRPCYQLQTSLT